MSDFHVIKYKDFRFSAEIFNQLHTESVAFIEQAIKTSSTKTVVVTHHVPTFLNYPPKYKGDPLNEAFAAELFRLIEDCKPNYWIYAHTHYNSADFKIGNTPLLTNQLGYVKYGEHHQFYSPKTIIF